MERTWRQFWWQAAISIFGGLCFIAIRLGIWEALSVAGIHPDAWVASMIDATGDPRVIAAVGWLSVGLFGLVGLVAAPALANLWSGYFPQKATVYRATMELGEIASLAAGKEPTLNITSGLEVTLYFVLRDAANDGRLEMVSAEGRGNYGQHSQTMVHHMLEFIERHPEHPKQLLEFARSWKANPQPRHFVMKAGRIESTSQLYPPTVTVSPPTDEQLNVILSKLPRDERRLLGLLKNGNGIFADIPRGREGSAFGVPIAAYHAMLDRLLALNIISINSVGSYELTKLGAAIVKLVPGHDGPISAP